jgi:hypothetical protein
LEWNPLEGRKACRISDPAEGDVQDEAEHEKYIEFFIDAAESFQESDLRGRWSLALTVAAIRWS